MAKTAMVVVAMATVAVVAMAAAETGMAVAVALETAVAVALETAVTAANTASDPSYKCFRHSSAQYLRYKLCPRT